MRLDKSSRRMRCASIIHRRLAWTLLILPVLAGLAPADEMAPDPVNPKGHVGDVFALGFTPDGKSLITTGSDGLAKIWDVATRTVRADLTGHEGKVQCVAISCDGETIATGGEDRTVRLWRITDGARLGTLSGHSGAVTALAFSPDGKVLASGSPDTTIRLWDVTARRALRTLEGHDAGVQGLSFSPDGRTLASASRDGTIRLWDVIVDHPPTLLGQQKEPFWCVAFAPDGKTVVSGGQDKMVRFWPIGEPKPKPPQEHQPQQGPQALQSQQPAPSLAVGNDVLAIAFAPDGTTLAVAVSDAQATVPTPGSVVFVDARARAFSGGSMNGHLGIVLALAFAPDGKTLATSGADRSIRLWDLASRTTRAVWLGPRPPGSAQERIMMHLDPVVALTYAPDGKTVITATGSPILTFWDVATHEIVRRLRDSSGAVRALAISPDGATLAFGGDGQVVNLWDLAAGRERAVLKVHEGAITCLSFAPDGKSLVSGSRDASAVIWDVAKGAERKTLARHTSTITSVAFAADGRTLATGSLDWTVKVWDLASGTVRHSLDGHRDAVDESRWHDATLGPRQGIRACHAQVPLGLGRSGCVPA
jgi:WD40 repeat protein